MAHRALGTEIGLRWLPRARPSRAPSSGSRSAFSVWAFALAAGVLFHEWQAVQDPWTLHTVSGIAAISVLLRPSAVWRTMVLGAVLAAEMLVSLPEPYNHALLAAYAGGAIVAWWVLLRLRAPADARDGGVVLDRIAPFLRAGLLLMLGAHALALLNTGFLAPATTCAAGIIESIPLVEVPDALMAPVIGMSLAVEIGLPLLLAVPFTRPIGIVVGLGYYLLLTVSGDPSFAGLGWAMMLLFLPFPTLARVAARYRTVLRRSALRAAALRVLGPSGGVRAFAVLTSLWVLGLGIAYFPPGSIPGTATRWTTMLACGAWLVAWAWVLFRLRDHWWLDGRPRRLGLAPRSVVLGVALLVLAVNLASPYLGLKTRYSSTMYTNLRTEAGHWNHLFVPESVRVFPAQDRLVQLRSSDDDDVTDDIEELRGDAIVPLEARRMLADHPDARVEYTLDGALRSADPVAADPVLGVPPSFLERTFGGFRTVPVDGDCRH